ncbi:MAG: PA2779 family protein [Desulfobacteraceae bacterium]|nr:MAG: PA2779 family protein [Desulfobacteraceae bacterium]
MRVIREKSKPLSIFMAIFVLVLSVPYQPALAAIIGTETMIDLGRAQEARDHVNNILAREDVKAAFIAQGINPQEAKARIDTLSNAEIIDLADQIDQLPAGGSTLETVLIVALIVFLVLLFTDLMGYTDIFPFVKK